MFIRSALWVTLCAAGSVKVGSVPVLLILSEDSSAWLVGGAHFE